MPQRCLALLNCNNEVSLQILPPSLGMYVLPCIRTIRLLLHIMIHVDQMIEWSMRHTQVVKIHDTDASDIENQNAKSEISKPSRTKHKNN